ncbi:hypothetical protein B0H19DRAFT_1262994 [Mycena capillaripes]|nr:hypothetical protein B0H19DRAFT_1262994 [Mycena capillaripes]
MRRGKTQPPLPSAGSMRGTCRGTRSIIQIQFARHSSTLLLLPPITSRVPPPGHPHPRSAHRPTLVSGPIPCFYPGLSATAAKATHSARGHSGLAERLIRNTSALEGLGKRDQFVGVPMTWYPADTGPWILVLWEAASYNDNGKSTVAICVDETDRLPVYTSGAPSSSPTSSAPAAWMWASFYGSWPFVNSKDDPTLPSPPKETSTTTSHTTGLQSSSNLGKLKAALVNRYERYSRSRAIKMDVVPALTRGFLYLSSFFIPVIPSPYTWLCHLLPFVSTHARLFPSAFSLRLEYFLFRYSSACPQRGPRLERSIEGGALSTPYRTSASASPYAFDSGSGSAYILRWRIAVSRAAPAPVPVAPVPASFAHDNSVELRWIECRPRGEYDTTSAAHVYTSSPSNP